MGAAKDLWMTEVEQIGEQFCDGTLTRDEAVRELERKGFDRREANDMLDELIA